MWGLRGAVCVKHEWEYNWTMICKSPSPALPSLPCSVLFLFLFIWIHENMHHEAKFVLFLPFFLFFSINCRMFLISTVNWSNRAGHTITPVSPPALFVNQKIPLHYGCHYHCAHTRVHPIDLRCQKGNSTQARGGLTKKSWSCIVSIVHPICHPPPPLRSARLPPIRVEESSFSQDMQWLLERGVQFADVAFYAGDSGKELGWAHAAVLCAVSPYFRQLLLGPKAR